MPAGGVDITLGVTGHGAGIGTATQSSHPVTAFCCHSGSKEPGTGTGKPHRAANLSTEPRGGARLERAEAVFPREHRHESKQRFAQSRTRHSVSSRARPANSFRVRRRSSAAACAVMAASVPA